MRNELKQIIDVANNLLKAANVGREFTMNYVVNRFVAALDEHPHDPVICGMAQVIHTQAKTGKLTTSQKELYSIYNHFAGLSSTSAVKDVIGDLLQEQESKTPTTSSTIDVNRYSPELEMRLENNPLEGLFDSKAIKGSTYFDPTIAKLAKNKLIEELDTIGVPANSISVFGGNEHAIMFEAIFKNALGEAHIAIPVEITNGVSAPVYFYSKGQFVDLDADNLNKHIVEIATINETDNVGVAGGIKAASGIVAPGFEFDTSTAPIDFGKTEMPEALKDLANFENAIIDTTTSFPVSVVQAAKAICMRELGSMGLRSQVSLAESNDSCLICRAELDSAMGKVEIKMPVEVINDRPQIPALFYNESEKDKIYDFTKHEVVAFLTSAKPDNGRILRYGGDFFNMTYNQLKEEIIAGVANKDYVRAEQALNRIEDCFGSDQHKQALNDYTKYLTHSVVPESAPKHKCRLLITKGSIEPRCGHYNVAISRVDTNAKGDCVLLDRQAKYDNLAESAGTMIRSNKITLT